MVGAPKHVKKALAAGVDLICAQVKLPAQFFWFSTLFADTNSRVVKEGAIQEMLQLQFWYPRPLICAKGTRPPLLVALFMWWLLAVSLMAEAWPWLSAWELKPCGLELVSCVLKKLGHLHVIRRPLSKLVTMTLFGNHTCCCVFVCQRVCDWVRLDVCVCEWECGLCGVRVRVKVWVCEYLVCEWLSVCVCVVLLWTTSILRYPSIIDNFLICLPTDVELLFSLVVPCEFWRMNISKIGKIIAHRK